MNITSGIRRTVALACLLLGGAIGWSAAAHAVTTEKLAVVVPVSGLIDPANESLIVDTIRSANAQRADLIVLQLNSQGATDAHVSALTGAVLGSKAPVAVWIGPSGAQARGVAAELAVAAPLSGMSNGASIGPAAPLRLDRPNVPTTSAVADQLGALAERNGRLPAPARQLATTSFSTKDAVSAGVVDVAGSTLVEFIGNLDGRTIQTADGPKVISTAQPAAENATKRELIVQVQFSGLSLGQQLSHALTSPSIAYLLLVTGLALIVFEFFAASIGIAGVVGAVCLVAAFTGFGHLPMHWWAVALIAFGVFGFAIDVQVGRFGVWSGIGLVAAAVGSWFLYGGASQLHPAWWVQVLVLLGLVTFMLGGMTAIVRTRYSTSTIGREGLIGAMGSADVDIAPDGIALIDNARWSARTNRATPIKAGDALRVVSVEGFVLEVEPEAGGAKDYRERARNRGASADSSSSADPSDGSATTSA